MGNTSSTKSKTSTKTNVNVYLSFHNSNFDIAAKPQNPSQARINERTWNEFVSCCETATKSANIDTLRTERRAMPCRKDLARITFIMAAIGEVAIIASDLRNNTSLLPVLIIGLIVLLGTAVYWGTASSRSDDIKKRFLHDVNQLLSTQLSTLNSKYHNQIQFNLQDATNDPHGGDKNVFAFVIQIVIWGNVTYVQYVPDAIQKEQTKRQQHAQQMIQTTPQNGQIFMVQMPDGRMVPTQMTHPQPVVHQQPQRPQVQVQYQPHVQVQYPPHVVVQQLQPHVTGYNQGRQHVPSFSYEPDAATTPTPSAPELVHVELGEAHDREGGEGGGQMTVM
eukprot:635304_1